MQKSKEIKILIAVLAVVAVIVAGILLWINNQRSSAGINTSQNTNQANNTSKEMNQMSANKVLIAYYSRTGNTKAVAELIHDRVGGDLVQIETKDPRPSNYRAEVNQNAQEQRDDTLPALKTEIPNFDEYSRVFIGMPTWNMAMPQAGKTFMESYDFSGKTVIPFNTHGGYGAGSVFSQIRSEAKGAKVLDGFSVEGGQETNGILLAIKDNRRVEVSKEVDDWLQKINYGN